MLSHRTISCDLEVKQNDDGRLGIFKGYASTFGNVDRDDDIIVKGAFGDIADPRKIKLLWQHNMAEPIGIWTKMREDDKGLYVEGQLALKTQRGAEAYELMKMGALGDMSIGFRTLDSEAGRIDGGSSKAARTVRRIKKVKLYEVSVVTIPANPLATVDAVKAAQLAEQTLQPLQLTEREFERRLRDAGCSRKQAAIMVSEGFEGLRAHFEAVLRDAAQISCKDARTILVAGYRAFVAQSKQPGNIHADTSVDDDGHQPEAAEGKAEAGIDKRSDAHTDDRKGGHVTDDRASDRSSDRASDRVGQRDADGADTSAKSTSIDSDDLGVFLSAFDVSIGLGAIR